MQLEMNALHLAALKGSLELVEYLAPLAGDRICDEDLSTRNCLDWAIFMKHQSLVLYLSSSFPVLRTKVGLSVSGYYSNECNILPFIHL